MNQTRRVFSNISYIMLARAAFRVLNAVVIIVAARYLGVDRYGMFETALAWSNAFFAMNDIGMSSLVVRESSRDKTKMSVYFGNALLVEVVLSVVLFAAIILIGIGVGYNTTTVTLIAILSGASLVYEFRKAARGVFRVLLRMKSVAILEIINGALYLLITLWIIAAVSDKDLGLLGIAHSRLWVNVAVIGALLVYAIKLVRPAFSPGQILPMLKQSYVFVLYNMFILLFIQTDSIILSIMNGTDAVGPYGAAAKLVTIFLFIPVMVFQVIMPFMYRLSATDMDKYRRINRTVWKYLAAIGVPTGIGLTLVANDVVSLVYGEEFIASVLILQLLGWFLALRYLGVTPANALTTTDRQGLRAGLEVAAVVLNIILDIILIRSYGAAGAAIATVIAEACLVTTCIWAARKRLMETWRQTAAPLLPVLAATAGMGAVVTLAEPRLHVIFVVILGAVAYAILLWAFRFFQPYDKKVLKQIISKDQA